MNNERTELYMAYGICAGGLLGTIIGSLFNIPIFKVIPITVPVCVIAGMLICTLTDKNDKNDKNK